MTAEKKTLLEEGRLILFRTIRIVAISITGLFFLIDLFVGLYAKSLIEAVMSAIFLSTFFFSREKNVMWAMNIFMVALVVGIIVMMVEFSYAAVWIPALSILAFGLFGQRYGKYWSVLIGIALFGLLLVNYSNGFSVYSVRSTIAIFLSYIAIAWTIHYFFYQMELQGALITKEVSQRERLELAKTLSGGIAHVVNNKLQTVFGRTEILKEKVDGDLIRHLDEISETALEISGNIHQLQAYSGYHDKKMIQVNLNDLISKTCKIWQADNFPDSGSVIVKYPERDIYCIGDRELICEAITELLDNAREASNAINVIEVELREKHEQEISPGSGVAEISIMDNGEGMEQDFIEKAYEPFVTSRFKGRGLGLAAVKGIMQIHEGDLTIFSNKERGTNVVMSLPLYKPSNDN